MASEMNSSLDDLKDKIDKNGPCEFLVDPCGFGYECKTKENTGICIDKCYSYPPLCSSGGNCYLDYKDNKTKCRCQDTDEYYYSGDRCEVQNKKVQAFSLTTKDYAIMAGSSAGAVMVIIIIFCMIRFLRKRYRKNKEDKELNDSTSNLTVARTSVLMSQMTTPTKSRFASDYVDGSCFPEMGKHTRIYRNPQTGEEAIIYQPTSMESPLYAKSRDLETKESERMAPRSFYDFFDTEEPYKIKRPNLKGTGNWPL